jgi:hypothetical protein
MFAMTEKNTMEYSEKANRMLKYRLYRNTANHKTELYLHTAVKGMDFYNPKPYFTCTTTTKDNR